MYDFKVGDLVEMVYLLPDVNWRCSGYDDGTSFEIGDTGVVRSIYHELLNVKFYGKGHAHVRPEQIQKYKHPVVSC